MMSECRRGKLKCPMATQETQTDISKVKTTTLRVRMMVYNADGTSDPETPIVQSDEPFFGGDEMVIQAWNLTRDLRRHQETEQ